MTCAVIGGLQATKSVNVKFNSDVMANNGKMNDVNQIKDRFDRGDDTVNLVARLLCGV